VSIENTLRAIERNAVDLLASIAGRMRLSDGKLTTLGNFAPADV